MPSNDYFLFLKKVRHDGSAIDIAHFEQPLTAHNLFRGSCLLPFARDTAWVTEYTLNVSYDGKEFTESIKLYVYQSECQKHIPDDGRDQFLLKVEFQMVKYSNIDILSIQLWNDAKMFKKQFV